MTRVCTYAKASAAILFSLPFAVAFVPSLFSLLLVHQPVARGASPTSTGEQADAENNRAPKVYALIVANNHSLESGVASLSFADDDGAKYYELFTAMGAQTRLLAVLDADAQQRFPDAMQNAQPPRREALLAAANSMFTDMRNDRIAGIETILYFVYSGHGHMGPNNEGLLNLLDTPLGRSDLYRDIIAPSPATWNHIIIDACNAYFVVNKRGTSRRQGDHTQTIRRFLDQEELRSYPNTGVILAASSESETHEWGRWRAGIFSHELRSALLGGADVDGDGLITYAEAATSVEAANAAIDDPRARLRVYARPPAARVDLPLMNLARFSQQPRVIFGNEAHRLHIEDGRGVRVADVHRSGEVAYEMVLLGQPPFVLREAEHEAVVAGDSQRVMFSELAFASPKLASRGSLERSFRKALFATAFGPSFFQGAMAVRGPQSQNWDGWFGSVVEPVPLYLESAVNDKSAALAISGWVSVSLGGAALVAGAVAGNMGNRTHDEYAAATDPATAKSLKRQTEQEQLAANALFIGGGAVVAVGVTLLLVDIFGGTQQVDESTTVGITPLGGGFGIALKGQY